MSASHYRDTLRRTRLLSKRLERACDPGADRQVPPYVSRGCARPQRLLPTFFPAWRPRVCVRIAGRSMADRFDRIDRRPRRLVADRRYDCRVRQLLRSCPMRPPLVRRRLRPYTELCSICSSVELRTSERSYPPSPHLGGSRVFAIQVRIAKCLSMLADAVRGRSDLQGAAKPTSRRLHSAPRPQIWYEI